VNQYQKSVSGFARERDIYSIRFLLYLTRYFRAKSIIELSRSFLFSGRSNKNPKHASVIRSGKSDTFMLFLCISQYNRRQISRVAVRRQPFRLPSETGTPQIEKPSQKIETARDI
jgi:hypothetical protein